MEVAESIRRERRHRVGPRGFNNMERHRPMARPPRPRGSVRTQRGDAAGHIPRGDAERRRFTIFRTQLTHERRQQRRHVSCRGRRYGLRCDAKTRLQQSVPLVLAVAGRAIGVAGRSDE